MKIKLRSNGEAEYRLDCNANQQNVERNYNWHTDEEKSAVKNLEDRLKKALDRIEEIEEQLKEAESRFNKDLAKCHRRQMELYIENVEFRNDML